MNEISERQEVKQNLTTKDNTKLGIVSLLLSLLVYLTVSLPYIASEPGFKFLFYLFFLLVRLMYYFFFASFGISIYIISQGKSKGRNLALFSIILNLILIGLIVLEI